MKSKFNVTFYCTLMFLLLTEAGICADIFKIPQKAFYANRQSSFLLKSNRFTNQQVNWKIIAFKMTLAQGSTRLDGRGRAKVTFKLPPVKEGLTISGKLQLATSGVQGKVNIFIFSPSPFINKQSIKELKINLLGFDEASKLETLFIKHQLAYVKIDDLDNFQGKVLIISGIDFEEFPNASEQLIKLARKGARIIILPSTRGYFELPPDQTSSIVLETNRIITSLNHKFDQNFAAALKTNSKFSLSSWDEKAALKFSKQSNGFSYCKIVFAKGSVTICGWDILSAIPTNPTALYLLKTLILNK